MTGNDSTQTAAHALTASTEAFSIYKKIRLRQRANFLRRIAQELESRNTALLNLASQETHLEKDRLEIEFVRTIFQLTSYAEACAEGTWLDVRIDTADEQSSPPKPDLRKTLVPLGPVVVFGASNFPFAYSTAGGDTASALAAGCTVILKAHPAHAATSAMVAEAVHAAAKQEGLPEGIFLHLPDEGFTLGQALVLHPLTKAVAFTGSFEGGKALFDLANKRPTPIPVFAEMGSINPVFLLPEKLQNETTLLAAALASSITQSVGQFCTNPGLLVGIKSKALDEFKRQLGDAIANTPPAKMLHRGIGQQFHLKRKTMLAEGANIVAASNATVNDDESMPTLAFVSGQQFLSNPQFHKEVFGPFSLLVECENEGQMLEVANALEGQLTCTLMATKAEAKRAEALLQLLTEKCGRLILNAVPTGVRVALSMQHGGPFPATTDSRFTAVGADALKRFARPVCYQNFDNDLLPEELKSENPLGVWRTVNNVLTREALPPH